MEAGLTIAETTYEANQVKLEEVKRCPNIIVGTCIFSSLWYSTGIPLPLLNILKEYKMGMIRIVNYQHRYHNIKH